MALEEPNLISRLGSLVTKTDHHQNKALQSIDEAQNLYNSTTRATKQLLQYFKDGSVSLKGNALLDTMHTETVPLLKEMGVLEESFNLLAEDTDIKNMDDKNLALLEDRVHELEERVRFSRTHLNEKVWKTAHDHSMKLAMLCRLDPHESVRTINSHMAQGK